MLLVHRSSSNVEFTHTEKKVKNIQICYLSSTTTKSITFRCLGCSALTIIFFVIKVAAWGIRMCSSLCLDNSFGVLKLNTKLLCVNEWLNEWVTDSVKCGSSRPAREIYNFPRDTTVLVCEGCGIGPTSHYFTLYVRDVGPVLPHTTSHCMWGMWEWYNLTHYLTLLHTVSEGWGTGPHSRLFALFRNPPLTLGRRDTA